MKLPLLFLSLVSFMIVGCSEDQTNPKRLSTFNENGSINAVIEIPAGTNKKMEYDYRSNKFEQDEIEGSPRSINFLSYPGNYGFIPGTRMTQQQGGDGDALDVLVLSESQPTGTSIQVKPIGILLLEDNGEKDHKVIAIPTDTNLQTIKADGFMDFMIEYDAAKQIIETWFLNYKGYGEIELIRWEDEKFAFEEIKKVASR